MHFLSICLSDISHLVTNDYWPLTIVVIAKFGCITVV